MTATYAAARRTLGRAMPPPEVSLVATTPPRLTEMTEAPDSRWVATAEKVWAATHPANQGLAIVALAVISVALVRTLPRLVPLLRAWKGQGDGKADRTPDAPPPDNGTDALEKRISELLEVVSGMAHKLQRVEQGMHNLSAEVALLDKRIGHIESRVVTAVSREEMGIALGLVRDLARGR